MTGVGPSAADSLDDVLEVYDCWGPQIISNASIPANPLCCNSTENGLPFSIANHNDTAFVSGAYQPIINLEVANLLRNYVSSASRQPGAAQHPDFVTPGEEKRA